ncbi:hypothetical protein NUM3379_15700 [Kineococcus sp. NUM-3379]
MRPPERDAPSLHVPEDDLVLLALGEDAGPGAAAHVTSCGSCAAELDAWRRVVRAGRGAEPVPVPPPAGTWEAIAAQTGTSWEAAADPAPAEAAPPVAPADEAPPVAPADEATSAAPGPGGRVVAFPAPRTAGRRRWLPVAAALLAGLAGGLGAGLALGGRTPERDAPGPVALARADLAPLARAGAGSARVLAVGDHRELAVDVRDLPDPDGGFYEVWLLSPEGGLVSLGAVVGPSARVPLPAGVDLERFAVVDVSREPLDGDPGHSSDSVLRGTLTLEG